MTDQDKPHDRIVFVPHIAPPTQEERDRLLEIAQTAAYEAGESSGYADWVGQLDDVLPDDVELAPSKLAAWIRDHTREEWCVTGEPGDGYPVYAYTWREDENHPDPEREARGFIALNNAGPGWAEGPHLWRRVVITSEWERIDP